MSTFMSKIREYLAIQSTESWTLCPCRLSLRATQSNGCPVCRSDPWEYSQSFDYIHTRAISGCWSSFEKQIAEQAFAALEPGGWFESQEMDSTVACDDDTLDPEGPMARWFRDLTIAGESCDRPIIVGATLREVYERVGFVEVHERIFKVPTNGWAKDEGLKMLGRMWERNLLQGLSGFSFSLFNRVFGRTAAEIEVSSDFPRRLLIIWPRPAPEAYCKFRV